MSKKPSSDQVFHIVEKMGNKIQLTNDRSVLQQSIYTQLPQLLSLLSFPDVRVRNKVIEVLTNINKRIKIENEDLKNVQNTNNNNNNNHNNNNEQGATSNMIQLPFKSILQLYLNPPSDSPFVRNFSQIFLDLAYKSSSDREKADVLSMLLPRISSRTEPQQSMLLRFMLDSVLYMNRYPSSSSSSPSSSSPSQSSQNNEESEENAQFALLRQLFQTSVRKSSLEESQQQPPQQQQNSQENNSNEPNNNNGQRVTREDVKLFLFFLKDVLLLKSNYKLTGDVLSIPEGLSVASVKRIIGDRSLDAKQIMERKEAIGQLISSDLLTDNDALPLLIVGSVDGQEPLSSLCENRLKKLTMLDFEDGDLVETLCDLYLGKKWNRAQQSTNLKVKIIYYLTKSVRAANCGEPIRDILFDALFNEFAPAKLKSSGMQLFIWILNEGTRENTESFAKVTMSQLIDHINRLSSASSSNVGELSQMNIMKEHFYTALGSLAKKFPETVRDKFYIVQLFFTALVREEPRIKISVLQGLSSLIEAYKNPDAQLQQNFEQLFLRFILDPNRNPNAAAAVLRCANRLFPFEHIPSRFINLLCANDQSLNLREEAYRGSDLERFTKYRQLEAKEEFHHPDFVPFTQYVFDYLSNPESPPITPGAHFALIEFFRNVLNASAAKHGVTLREYVCSVLRDCRTTSGEPIINAYTLCLQRAFHEHSNADLLLEASSAVLHLCSLDIETFGPVFAEQFSFIKRYMFNGDEQSREQTARLVAVLYMFMSHSNRRQLLDMLKDNMANSTEGYTHGAILTLGNIVALTFKRTHDTTVPEELRGIVEDIIDLIVIGSHRPLIPRACYYAFGEIARQGALCYLGQYRKALTADVQKKLKKVINSKDEAIDLLLEQLHDSKLPNNVKEKIITSLSMLCLHEPSEAILQKIIDSLFGLSTDKAEEIQFTIGEALSCICGGTLYCTLYQNDEYELIFNRPLTNEQLEYEQSLRKKFTTSILTQIIHNGVLNPKKIVRQSSSLWLLATTRYCSDSPYLRTYLKDIQKAFSILLTDTNEITIEVAGRGMAYVYQLGDKQTQKELVESLMNSLAGKKNTKDIKLTQDSELLLFPEDVKNMDKGMGTYKELVSVANDIGKPEMIYQMLAVSSHHAIWNAKKAAAFSAVSIASFTQEHGELDKVLPTIVPKLFRYQFDPNPTINRSMTDMWNSLVRNSKETVDKYFAAIVKEVISGLESELWRVREASCHALSDLISGRTFIEMEPFLEESMIRVFRVTDDIKESGRKAAASTLRKLGAFTVKCCNPKYTTDRNDVTRALRILIPVYLNTGLQFPAKEVVSFSIEHLQLICQVSMHLIRPHITEVIGTLLEQMSVLEPAAFNYIQLNADKYNVSQEQLESMRMSMAQSGPINDIISTCARHIDEEVCDTLVPRVVDILRSGVGLPTRTATAKFIGDLGKFHSQAIVKKHVPTLLTAVMRTVQTTSSSVEKKVLASSLPYVLKNAKVSQGKIVLQQILNLYIQNNDEGKSEEAHYASGMLMDGIARHVPAIIKRFNELVLPVIFVARHDESKRVSTIWESVWEECMTTSPKDTIRLYIEPIADTCIQLLNHQSWKMKKQGGQGLNEIGLLLNIDINQAQRNKIITNLLSNIPGRVWEGKEILLEALASVCESFKKDVNCENEEQGALLNKVLHVALRECNRNNIVFKLQALSCLRRILKVPLFERMMDEEIFTLARNTLNECQQVVQSPEDASKKEAESPVESSSKDSSGTMSLERKREEKQKEDIMCQTIELTPLIIPSNHVALFEREIDLLTEQLSSLRLSVSVASSLLNALLTIVSRVLSGAAETQQALLTPQRTYRFIELLMMQTDPAIRQVLIRTKAFETFGDFLKLLKQQRADLLEQVEPQTTNLLQDAINKEKDIAVQSKYSTLLNIL